VLQLFKTSICQFGIVPKEDAGVAVGRSPGAKIASQASIPVNLDDVPVFLVDLELRRLIAIFYSFLYKAQGLFIPLFVYSPFCGFLFLEKE
jgi:hypothetical protein